MGHRISNCVRILRGNVSNECPCGRSAAGCEYHDPSLKQPSVHFDRPPPAMTKSTRIKDRVRLYMDINLITITKWGKVDSTVNPVRIEGFGLDCRGIWSPQQALEVLGYAVQEALLYNPYVGEIT